MAQYEIDNYLINSTNYEINATDDFSDLFGDLFNDGGVGDSDIDIDTDIDSTMDTDSDNDNHDNNGNNNDDDQKKRQKRKRNNKKNHQEERKRKKTKTEIIVPSSSLSSSLGSSTIPTTTPTEQEQTQQPLYIEDDSEREFFSYDCLYHGVMVRIQLGFVQQLLGKKSVKNYYYDTKSKKNIWFNQYCSNKKNLEGNHIAISAFVLNDNFNNNQMNQKLKKNLRIPLNMFLMYAKSGQNIKDYTDEKTGLKKWLSINCTDETKPIMIEINKKTGRMENPIKFRINSVNKDPFKLKLKINGKKSFTNEFYVRSSPSDHTKAANFKGALAIIQMEEYKEIMVRKLMSPESDNMTPLQMQQFVISSLDYLLSSTKQIMVKPKAETLQLAKTHFDCHHNQFENNLDTIYEETSN